MSTYMLDEGDYINDLDEYLVDMEEYQRARARYATARACVRPVKVSLRNEGTASARNVVVEIDLPSHVTVATEEEVDWYYDEEGYDEPQQPAEPRLVYNIATPFPHDFIEIQQVNSPSSARTRDQRGPRSLTRQGRRTVYYNISTLAAGQSVDDLNAFHLMLNEIAQDTELVLNVTVFADGLSQPQVMVLHLHVRVVEEEVANAARHLSKTGLNDRGGAGYEETGQHGNT